MRSRRFRDHAGLWTLVAAAWFGVAAVAVNVRFLDGLSPSSIGWHATAATVLTAAPLWYAGVERHGSRHARQGAVVGLSVGVLVHPVFWLVFLVVSAPLALPGAPLVILGFGPIGLLFFGWLTVPSGLVAGATLGVVRKLAHG